MDRDVESETSTLYKVEETKDIEYIDVESDTSTLNEVEETKDIEYIDVESDTSTLNEVEETKDIEYIDVATEFFRDKIRCIDFVLVHVNDGNESKNLLREIFQANLQAEGLEIEMERSIAHKDNNIFIKIHAPISVLTKYAQLFNWKMFLKKKTTDAPINKNRKYEVFEKFFNQGIEDIIGIKEEVNLAELSETEQEDLFTNAERSALVFEILYRAKFGNHKREVGIFRLLNSKIYSAAYPIHNGNYHQDPPEGEIPLRRQLYSQWAYWRNYNKSQPYQTIMMYFGEEVALYFAWLEFYTYMLVPASVVGLICLLYGFLSWFSAFSVPAKEVCNSKYYMCPLCEHYTDCGFHKLSSSCLYATLTHLFDNMSTMFFALFMALWSTTFLELWKRRQEVFMWCWKMKNSSDWDQETRPEYEAVITESNHRSRVNPVTGEEELRLKNRVRLGRIAISVLCSLLIITVLLIILLIVIINKVLFVGVGQKSKQKYITMNANIMGSFVSSLIYFTLIMIAKPLYELIAGKLTDMEYNRTEAQYEGSYTFKLFAFEFVNYYSYPIYIAFFKGALYTHPGDKDVYTKFFGIALDLCDPAGCISELLIQMFTIMAAKHYKEQEIQPTYPIAPTPPAAGSTTRRPAHLDNPHEPDNRLNYTEKHAHSNIQEQQSSPTPGLRLERTSPVPRIGKVPTEIRTSISPSSAVEQLNTTSALANYAIEAGCVTCRSKQIINNLVEVALPWILRWWRQRHVRRMELPRWEADYKLTPYTKWSLFNEIQEMVIQYGFVTLFVTAFPIAPLLALINNIFEIRIDANKFLTGMRRPLARNLCCLGAWDYVIQFITYLSVLTNACVIGFTSDFVPRLVYILEYREDQVGYAESSMSVYPVDKLPRFVLEADFEECLYPGSRYPAGHPQEFQRTLDFWQVLAAKLVFVLVFENVVLLLTGLLAWAIPDNPAFIKELKIHEQKASMETRRKNLEKKRV
uniref:Anoctamin n=1 Tax=Timema californicum TaxID=61474 RepID=A0A7R9PCK2_TIMCA|nr:unnamed protein product [Timema californicum]